MTYHNMEIIGVSTLAHIVKLDMFPKWGVKDTREIETPSYQSPGALKDGPSFYMFANLKNSALHTNKGMSS